MNEQLVGITIVGLGPGNPAYVTRQAWDLLVEAPEIYLRTRQHPVVNELPHTLEVHSFDHLYEQESDFAGVYQQIVAQVLWLAKRPEGVIYGVPGHPFVGEATVQELIEKAEQENIPINVISGMSFIEPTFSLLKVDPLPQTTIMDALELVDFHHPPFPPHAPVMIAQIYSRMVASDVKLVLMCVYPDDHLVSLVHAVSTPDEVLEQIPLYALDRSEHYGNLTALFIPPLDAHSSFENFQNVIARLRAPDGCPWDREQTHESLRPYLLEESYEVLAAIDDGVASRLKEELGDLLIQIVLHAQIATESGGFNMVDILSQVHAKLVHRHPHVFSDVNVESVEAVKQNWAHLKTAERVAKGWKDASILDGVAPSLPALAQSDSYQQRVAQVGFDWEDIDGVAQKVTEEYEELIAASDQDARIQELGDLLFAVVNLARWYRIDPESALRQANRRFYDRFTRMEKIAREQNRSLNDLSILELERLWQVVKSK